MIKLLQPRALRPLNVLQIFGFTKFGQDGPKMNTIRFAQAFVSGVMLCVLFLAGRRGAGG